jgi:hypothetical protein
MSEVLEKPVVTPAARPLRPPAATVDQMVAKYVSVRDAKSALKKRHAEEIAKYDNAMETLELWMLEMLNNLQVESMRTNHGTAYKTVRTSAKVMDWPQTLQFIKDTDAWELLEARVSKLAAQAIIDDTKLPIPGVDVTSEVVVNVRRAASG